MTTQPSIYHKNISLQKRKEILNFKGLHDCSSKRYPNDPKRGDFYICGINGPGENGHLMSDGQIVEYGNFLIYNGMIVNAKV